MPSKEAEQLFDKYHAAGVKDGADKGTDALQGSAFVANGRRHRRWTA